MENNKQSTSSIQDILKDVDSAVAADQKAKDKKHKAVIAAVIVCFIIIAVLAVIMIQRHKQDIQFREGVLETAVSVTSEYGVDDLTVVSFSNKYPKTVVFQSDMFQNLTDDDKMEVFREFNKQTGTYSWYLNCSDEGTVTIISGDIRYTARINDYGSSHYRYLYADGDEILKDIYMAPPGSSSSSSGGGTSGGRTGACSGGSVGCRAGYHPCHEMSNGFCNQCCKG